MNRCYRTQKGVVLIISMIFLCVFCALAISLATLSDTNAQLANNQHKVNSALSAAQSGLEIVGLWLSEVAIPGSTTAAQRFNLIANCFESAAYDISNININHDSSSITIPSVILDSTNGQNFYAEMGPLPSLDDPNILQADVTGVHDSITSITRTIRVNYIFGNEINPIFDYGVATKGALSLAGNVALGSINFNGDIYIESLNNDDALTMEGPSAIAGDVFITNPDAVATVGNSSSIGGETGQAAIDNHVFTGSSPEEFPIPNPGHFEPYVVSTIDLNDVYFENVRILPNTNPEFASDTTFKGVLFIEVPNVVIFSGNASITGIIVGNGDLNDNSGTNQIIFMGGVNSQSVEQLTEPQFDQLRNETGTFIMAPGFGVGFGGNFETLSGAIVANGVNFFGDAGGTIDGSIINYSDTTMEISGSTSLTFNRSGTTELPAGFITDIILKYDPASYCEVIF